MDHVLSLAIEPQQVALFESQHVRLFAMCVIDAIDNTPSALVPAPRQVRQVRRQACGSWAELERPAAERGPDREAVAVMAEKPAGARSCLSLNSAALTSVASPVRPCHIANMANGQVVLVTTESLAGGPPMRTVYYVNEENPEKAEAIVKSVMAPNEMVVAWGPLPEAAVKALGLRPGEFTHA
jgi:hypothetical protein